MNLLVKSLSLNDDITSCSSSQPWATTESVLNDPNTRNIKLGLNSTYDCNQFNLQNLIRLCLSLCCRLFFSQNNPWSLTGPEWFPCLGLKLVEFNEWKHMNTHNQTARNKNVCCSETCTKRWPAETMTTTTTMKCKTSWNLNKLKSKRVKQ